MSNVQLDSLGLDIDTPSKMTINHPTTGQPLVDEAGNEAYLELLSADSEAAGQHEHEVLDRRLKPGRKNQPTARSLEADDVELWVRLCKGWHLVALDGRAIDLPFTQVNVKAIFGSRRMLWLKEQARSFINERANFSKTSSSS